jgi:TolB-like protein/Tfp pilus assembly protein PilF
MSFFEELSRRNVVKVAVLYVVASWLILQVADVLSSLLPVPEWTGSLVFIFLALGFPLVMIFSWVYELTPEGLKREREVERSQSVTHETGRKINILIIVMLVLAIGAVVADRLIPRPAPEAGIAVVEETAKEAPGDPGEFAAETSVPAPERSIAVLPFVNMSSDAEQEYFSDGLSEELLNLLAKVPELRVAARTSSFSLKGQNLQISQVGDILNVAHVLEGSVRKSGDRVRITVQLIHSEDGYHMWSEAYDRTLEDIFAIQDEIANEVVAQLKIALLGGVPKVEKTDPEAYTLVLRARHADYLGTVEGRQQAVALYRQALSIDPDYAAALTGLAAGYISQSGRADRPVDEGYSLAREAATQALEIDPNYATAHAILGRIADYYDGDLAAAARHIERALALDPGDPEIRRHAATLAMSLGRLNEAIELLTYAIARDPVNSRAHSNLALAYMHTGQMDSAIASFRTALALNPGTEALHGMMGRALLLKGEPEAALAAIQQEPSDWKLLELPLVYYALGQVDESDAVLAELIEKYAKEAAVNIAAIYAYRSQRDEAFSWLNRAVAEKDPGLSEIVYDPVFSSLHDDSRWQSFLESIGRSPEQLAAIGFDVTLPGSRNP